VWVHDVADFGCGYGTFTIPVARIIAGSVYAFDVDRDMVDAVTAKARAPRFATATSSSATS
jgi:predicted RNA methylase